MAVYDPGVNSGRSKPLLNPYMLSQPKGDGGFGIGDLIKAPFEVTGNLAKDIGQATLGFFPGVYKAIKDPIESAKLIGESYKDMYGPLASGDFKQFGQNLYDHPLGPILDVLTVATLGAGGVAKVPATLGKVGVQVSEKSTLGRIGTYAQRERLTAIDRPGAPGRLRKFEEDKRGKPRDPDDPWNVPREEQYFWTSKNPFTKARQKWSHGIAEKLATRGNPRLAQMAYERRWLGNLAGNMSAMEYMLGDLVRLQRAMDNASTNPQKRATLNRDYLKFNYGNADQHGRLIPVSDITNGKVNTKVLRYLVNEKDIYKKGPAGRAAYAGDSATVVQNFEKLGKTLSTTQLKRARIYDIDGVPHVKALHRASARRIGVEAANTANMALKLYYRSTTAWKAIVLGLAPRFVVNNTVGGALMHTADNMGNHAVFGLTQAWRHIYGDEKTAAKLEQALKQEGFLRENSWMLSNYGDQLGQGFYYSAGPNRTAQGRLTETAKLRGEADVQTQTLQKVTDPTFKFTSKIERWLRASAIISNVRGHPLIQAEMKRLKRYPKWKKARTEDLFNHVARDMHKRHPEISRQVAQDVEQTMGNYAALSGKERAIRAADPFYLWQRHIVKHGTHMALDRPGRTSLAVQIGNMGADFAQEGLGGEVPDFMQAFIPGSEGPENRILSLSTQGMNPYSTIGELATGAAAFLPGEQEGQKTLGEGIGPLMNPFLTAGIEEITGTSLLTGQPRYSREGSQTDAFLDQIGPLGRMLASPVAKLPHVTLAESIFDPPEYKTETLYAKTPQEYLLALMGVPFKWVNPDAAQRLARQQAARRGEEK